MKQIETRLFAAGVTILAIALYAFYPHNTEIPPDVRGFALVELFTSEGCSSCPPAEELAADIQKESTDKPVYILAYHVDYWDHQGWKDRFSNPAYSQRQKDYSNWLRTSDIYTPQVIVNGRKELVGSDEPALRSALKSALMTTPLGKVRLSARAEGSAGLAVDYAIDGDFGSDRLLLTVVEKSGVTKVTGGENRGRTLSHVQIVRSLTAVKAVSKGTVSLAVPAGFSFDPAKWEVVGFVQNGRTGEVFAANRAEFDTHR